MMKYAMVVSEPTKFSSLAFKHGIIDGIKNVAALGFNAVELAIRDPLMINVSEIKTLTQQLSLPIVALGTGQSYVEDGLSLTSSDSAVREDTIERIKAYVNLAAQLNKPKVIIGLIRGKKDNKLDAADAHSYFLEGMQEACSYGITKGIEFVLEPINRYETDIINTVDEALSFVDEVDYSNFKLLLDTFHMNIEEPIMEDSIRRSASASRLGHVHFADSNRWAPGCGHIDFNSLMKVLLEVGYKGAISAEILPLPEPKVSARMAFDYMNKLLSDHDK